MPDYQHPKHHESNGGFTNTVIISDAPAEICLSRHNTVRKHFAIYFCHLICKRHRGAIPADSNLWWNPVYQTFLCLNLRGPKGVYVKSREQQHHISYHMLVQVLTDLNFYYFSWQMLTVNCTKYENIKYDLVVPRTNEMARPEGVPPRLWRQRCCEAELLSLAISKEYEKTFTGAGAFRKTHIPICKKPSRGADDLVQTYTLLPVHPWWASNCHSFLSPRGNANRSVLEKDSHILYP